MRAGRRPTRLCLSVLSVDDAAESSRHLIQLVDERFGLGSLLGERLCHWREPVNAIGQLPFEGQGRLGSVGVRYGNPHTRRAREQS